MSVLTLSLIVFTIFHLTESTFVFRRSIQKRPTQVVKPTPKSIDDDELICQKKNPCPCEMRKKIYTDVEHDQQVEWTDYRCGQPSKMYHRLHCVQLQTKRKFYEDNDGTLLVKPIKLLVQYGCELRYTEQQYWGKRLLKEF